MKLFQLLIFTKIIKIYQICFSLWSSRQSNKTCHVAFSANQVQAEAQSQLSLMYTLKSARFRLHNNIAGARS